jgi:hypothetical protein
MAGGLVGAVLVTGLTYLGLATNVMQWNVIDVVARAISFGEYVPTNSANYVWGIAFYALFVLVAAPLCYAYWVYSYLPGSTVMRGFLYGLFLWFLMELLLMPLVGAGVFDRLGPNTAAQIISQFVLWAIYGLALGFIAGPQELWRQTTQQERPA